MPVFKPDQYTSVSPYLIVNDAQKTMDFLKLVFNAEQLRTHHHDDGRVLHAEVRIDDSIIMLGEAAPGWPAQPTHVHIYVKDVDSTYRLALKAGAESVQEPVQKGDQDKRGGVQDAGGTTWWIATQQSF